MHAFIEFPDTNVDKEDLQKYGEATFYDAHIVVYTNLFFFAYDILTSDLMWFWTTQSL